MPTPESGIYGVGIRPANTYPIHTNFNHIPVMEFQSRLTLVDSGLGHTINWVKFRGL
jgi:hypothetical protein